MDTGWVSRWIIISIATRHRMFLGDSNPLPLINICTKIYKYCAERVASPLQTPFPSFCSHKYYVFCFLILKSQFPPTGEAEHVNTSLNHLTDTTNPQLRNWHIWLHFPSYTTTPIWNTGFGNLNYVKEYVVLKFRISQPPRAGSQSPSVIHDDRMWWWLTSLSSGLIG